MVKGERVRASYTYALRGTTYRVEGVVTEVGPEGRWVRVEGEVRVSGPSFSFSFEGEEQYATQWVERIEEG